MSYRAIGLKTLKSSRQFQAVYRNGRKVFDKYFTVYLMEQSSPSLVLGLTVTRRIGNAVVRNRIKRLLREAFRLLSPQITKGIIVVIIAKPIIRSKGLNPIQEHLHKVLKKAGKIISP